MLRRVAILALAAALGAGSSVAVGACGEERGSVSVEDGGTGTGGTGTGKTGTSTTPTGSTPTETEKKPSGSGGY